jgi:hypothetical protein
MLRTWLYFPPNMAGAISFTSKNDWIPGSEARPISYLLVPKKSKLVSNPMLSQAVVAGCFGGPEAPLTNENRGACMEKIATSLENALSYQYAPAYTHVFSVIGACFRALGQSARPAGLGKVLASAANLYGACCLFSLVVGPEAEVVNGHLLLAGAFSRAVVGQ